VELGKRADQEALVEEAVEERVGAARRTPLGEWPLVAAMG